MQIKKIAVSFSTDSKCRFAGGAYGDGRFFMDKRPNPVADDGFGLSANASKEEICVTAVGLVNGESCLAVALKPYLGLSC